MSSPDFFSAMKQGEYYLLIDLKNLLDYPKQTVWGRLIRAVKRGDICKKKVWAFRSNKFFKTYAYYLPDTPSPPLHFEYPFKEQIESGDISVESFRANHTGSPQSFYNWIEQLIKMGIIKKSDIELKKRTKKEKSNEYIPTTNNAYMRWPLAHAWLMEQVKGRYAE